MAKSIKKLSIGSRIKRFFGGNDVEETKSEILDIHQKSGAFMVDTPFMFDGFGADMMRRKSYYDRIDLVETDGVLESAVKLLVTAALGGHETSGDVVFIEKKPDITPQQEKIIEEMANELVPHINKVIYQVAFTGAMYGDSYTRQHIKAGEGVISIAFNELTYPPNVVAYERAGETVGYFLQPSQYLYDRQKSDRFILNALQMSRFKMPRLRNNNEVISRSQAERMIMELTSDDMKDAPVRPSIVGGSLITEAVFTAWNNFNLSLSGMTMQRLVDSIDEAVYTYSIDGDKQSREAFKKSLERMFRRSKKLVEAVSWGGDADRKNALLGRHRHFIPVSTDGRQSITDTSTGGSRRSGGAVGIDDVMTNARLLAGAIGIDLSMLGFADQMAGGLGEGGFFRISAQAAENARVIRRAATDYIETVIETHIAAKYGQYFDPKDRFWVINFFGSLSALEAERRDSQNIGMTAGATMIQTLQQAKDMGMNKEAMVLLLTRQMGVDQDLAEKYVEFEAPPEEGGM